MDHRQSHSPPRSTIDIYEDDSALPATHDEDYDDSFVDHEVDGADEVSDDEHLSDGASDASLGEDHDDPFLASEADQSELQDEHIVQSIETSNHGPSHGHDYSFSRSTPVHIDSHVDPHLDYVERDVRDQANVTVYRGNERHYLDENRADDAAFDARKVSESISTLPDELEYYRSSLPGRSPLAAARSQNASRHASAMREPSQLHAPSPRQHHHSLSTPTATPLPVSRGHSRTNSAVKSDYRPVFRNPSSVRAMQMSSPSPSPQFGGSPLSGRRLRNNSALDSPRQSFHSSSRSFHATPTKRSTPRRPAPKKEHPLVLLHCTLTILEMPVSFPPEALDAAGASDKTRRDIALLNQKLDSTVLERGLLIQHPGDDYDLLEERILESLELRKPRVGGCGHFRSASVESAGHALREEEHEDEVKCDDCARHISPTLLPRDEHDRVRRWDVRVYAANGLMRAGAWSAAWREMEKVDVEVGVWIADALKCQLEDWALHHGDDSVVDAGTAVAAPKHVGADVLGPVLTRRVSDPTQVQVQHAARATGAAAMASPASRATTSRSGSISEHNPTTTRRDVPRPRSAASQSTHPDKLPLGTLLYNHLARLATKNSEALLAALVLVLGVWLGLRTLTPMHSAEAGPSGEAARLLVMPTAAATTSGIAGARVSEAAAAASSVPVATVTVTATATITQSPDVARLQLAACTFPAGEAQEGGQKAAEMTAVPRSAAAAVLAQLDLMRSQTLQAGTPPPSSSRSGGEGEVRGAHQSLDAVQPVAGRSTSTGHVEVARQVASHLPPPPPPQQIEGAGRRQEKDDEQGLAPLGQGQVRRGRVEEEAEELAQGQPLALADKGGAGVGEERT